FRIGEKKLFVPYTRSKTVGPGQEVIIPYYNNTYGRTFEFTIAPHQDGRPGGDIFRRTDRSGRGGHIERYGSGFGAEGTVIGEPGTAHRRIVVRPSQPRT